MKRKFPPVTKSQLPSISNGVTGALSVSTPLRMLYMGLMFALTFSSGACSTASKLAADTSGEKNRSFDLAIAYRLNGTSGWTPAQKVTWSDSVVTVVSKRARSTVFDRSQVEAIRLRDLELRRRRFSNWGLGTGLITGITFFSAAMLHPRAQEGDGHIRSMYLGFVSYFALGIGYTSLFTAGLIARHTAKSDTILLLNPPENPTKTVRRGPEMSNSNAPSNNQPW